MPDKRTDRHTGTNATQTGKLTERNRQMSAMTVQRKYLYSVFAHMHTQSVGVTVTRSYQSHAVTGSQTTQL